MEAVLAYSIVFLIGAGVGGAGATWALLWERAQAQLRDLPRPPKVRPVPDPGRTMLFPEPPEAGGMVEVVVTAPPATILNPDAKVDVALVDEHPQDAVTVVADDLEIPEFLRRKK